jgi:acetate kinase
MLRVRPRLHHDFTAGNQRREAPDDVKHIRPRCAPRAIPIGVSARHAHLSRATLDALFGAGHQLRVKRALLQPGQFAAEETITLVGPCGRIAEVRVLGPPRDADQVELARSDEILLGIDAPLKVSGDLAGTPGIDLVGPAGRVHIQHGVVQPLRHIHMSPGDARDLGVCHGQRVSVVLDSDGRDVVFGDVMVRVSPDFRLELHLDTDEGNAAGVGPGATATLQSVSV